MSLKVSGILPFKSKRHIIYILTGLRPISMNVKRFKITLTFSLCWLFSFAVKKFYFDIVPHLLIFAFVTFWCQIQKSLARSMTRNFYPCLSMFIHFRSYILVFNPFWIWFCEMCKRRIQIHLFLFAHCHAVSKETFIKESFLAQYVFLASL